MLVGHATSDDAAVYRIAPDRALVSTVDYFTPIVDEPYDFGAIAAANALSDIYAMGGTPLYALAIVGFPRDRLGSGVLEEILRGGVEKAHEAGIPIIGGHSIDDAEPKYGLAVTGTIHPDCIRRNVGARPGDRLFLTKPLGSGIIATAIKQGQATEAIRARAVQVMSTLNRDAANAMRDLDPRAVTDVTGFGLLGHLGEMVQAGPVAARIYASAVPVQAGVRELAARGIVPGGTRRNAAAASAITRYDERIDATDRLILADAQTSGGLLIAIAPERAAALREALEAAGTLAAAEVGQFIPGDGWIEVIP